MEWEDLIFVQGLLGAVRAKQNGKGLQIAGSKHYVVRAKKNGSQGALPLENLHNHIF